MTAGRRGPRRRLRREDLGGKRDGQPRLVAAFGPTHARVGHALVGVAASHRERGQCELAFPLLDRAAGIFTALRPESIGSVLAAGVRAECLTDVGRSREALPLLEKARSYLEASLPEMAFEADPPIARALEGMGRFAAACAVWKRVTDGNHGKADPAVRAERLGGLGACLTRVGRAREGSALLEKARALRAESPGDPRQEGYLALDLARAHRASGGDPAQIRALAERARDVGRNAGPAGARLARAAEGFLAR